MRETSLTIGNQLLVELSIRIQEITVRDIVLLFYFFLALLITEHYVHPSNVRICFGNFVKAFVAPVNCTDWIKRPETSGNYKVPQFFLCSVLVHFGNVNESNSCMII
jgi:hypothetical protein